MSDESHLALLERVNERWRTSKYEENKRLIAKLRAGNVEVRLQNDFQ